MTTTWRALPRWPYPQQEGQRDQFKAPFERTLRLLERELGAIRARDPLVGLVTYKKDLREDGTGLAPGARVLHAGAEVSFDLPQGEGWRRVTFHTDARRDYGHFDNFQANLRAIALGLEALRLVDRYGITQSGQQYAGFAQIEAPKPLEELGRQLVEQFGGIPEAIRATHPDTGGQWASDRNAAAVLAFRRQEQERAALVG